MKLLLIAGHGAGDPGAVSGVFQEAVETRRVVGALVRLLKGYCDVTQYPPARNAFSDFRTGQLNKQVPLSDFDFVLEIHFNASAAGPKDGKTKGVEIFVPTGAAETAAEEQICRAVAIFRRLCYTFSRKAALFPESAGRRKGVFYVDLCRLSSAFFLFRRLGRPHGIHDPKRDGAGPYADVLHGAYGF